MIELNIVVAERATLNYFSVDRIMGSISKAVDIFAGAGGMDKVIGRISMTNYTYEDLGGKDKALVDDGQKHGMFEVVEIGDDLWDDFMGFRKNANRNISWEQSAAVYWAEKMPNCKLISESELVLDFASSRGVPIISIDDLETLLFPNEKFELCPAENVPPFVVAPFDPRVDAEKVKAAFSDGLDGDLAVLKQKSYWVVVCVLFEMFGWLRLRNRASFCEWVNAHFHFDKPIDAKIDLKSAINKINVNERRLELWPDNKYRDLAFLLKDMFFGERQGLPNGYYVYAKEPLYLKPGRMWRRKD